jgi:hypothetical protein
MIAALTELTLSCTGRSDQNAADHQLRPRCHNHYAYEPQFTKDDDQMEKFVVGMTTKHHMYMRDGDYITP